MSLPFAALAASFPREVVRHVLNTEVACGRVHEIDGRYSLAVECFTRETLLALQTLAPMEPDRGQSARRRDLGSARCDETPERSHDASHGAGIGRTAVSAS